MTQPQTLNEWQDMFADIYGARNLDIEVSEMWLKIVAESSKIARLIRKENHKDLREAIPDFFAWFFAFADRYNVYLEDVIWEKFPGVCPYCEKQEYCSCLANKHSVYDKKNLNIIRKKNEKNKPKTLTEWIGMLTLIYGNVNTIVDQDKIGFHFLEEVGEVAEELSKEKPSMEKCNDEIADVFAWLVALTEKNKSIFDEISIEDDIFELYPRVCKKCGGNPCGCPKDEQIS